MPSTAYQTDSMERHAILFIYHKEPAICIERLIQIRGLNPWVPIFGLYGGDPANLSNFEPVVQLLDDHWVFPDDKPSRWKWTNTDKMMVRWFVERGNQLIWDVIFEYTWDLLLTEPVRRFVQLDSPRQLLWSHPLCTLDQLRKQRWYWVQPNVLDGPNTDFAEFCDYLVTTFNSPTEIYGSGFFFTSWTRCFFHNVAPFYEQIPGFLEYRIPSIARRLGFTFQDWQPRSREYQYSHFDTHAIPYEQIIEQSQQANGCTIFHPVYGLDGQSLVHTIYNR